MKRMNCRSTLVCVAVLAVLLAFGAYALTSGTLADHDCSGDGCIICLCSALGEKLAGCMLPVFGMAAMHFLPTCLQKALSAAGWLPAGTGTPVCLKVKLSN